MRQWVMQALLPIAGTAVFFAGLVVLGGVAREALRERETYAVRFADIECAPPPGMSKTDFLGEVQYLGEWPDRLELLDDRLTSRLAVAFAAHPWVEKVDRIEVARPAAVRVRLTYRTPALAVLVCDPPPVAWRAVDANGVLMPERAPSRDLPTFGGKAKAPSGRAGTPWGDPAVEAAARTAGCLRPHAGALRLAEYTVAGEDVIIAGPGGARVVWGSPPGSERAGEPGAQQKLERLLHYCERHGGLDKPAGLYEHDLRPADAPVHRPLDYRN